MNNDVDNTRLKELMAIEPDNLTPELQNELFDELKKARLFVPVNFISESFNENVEDKKISLDESISFEFLIFKQDEKGILPLFTDLESLEMLDDVNVINYSTLDIAELLIENDNIEEVIINPNTETAIGMTKESFVYYCLEEQFKDIFDIERDLIEYAVPLNENTVFYLRSKTPFMLEDSDNGIFTANVPFKVSSKDVYHTEYEYLNILVVPKDTMCLYLGNIVEDLTKQSDVILAPIIKFKLMEKKDENTFIWHCIQQDFNN